MINCIEQAYYRSSFNSKLNVLYLPLDGGFDLQLAKDFNMFCTQHVIDQIPYKNLSGEINVISDFYGDDEINFDCVFVNNRSQQFNEIQAISHNYHCPVVVMDHDLPMASAQEKLIRLLNGNSPKNLIFCYPHDIVKRSWVNYEGFTGESIKLPYCILKKHIPKNKNGIFILGDNVNDANTINSMKSIHYNHQYIKNHHNIEDIRDLMHISEIFLSVVPDSQCPLMAFEAAAYGNLVVINRTRWSEQFFTDGENALLFNDSKEMIQRTRSIIKNKERLKQISEAGRRLVLDSFCKNKFTKACKNLIETINNKVYIR